MFVKVALEPKESWQSQILCTVTIYETRSETNLCLCPTCKMDTPWRIDPRFEIEINSNPNWIPEKEIRERVFNSLKKVYEKRPYCIESKCLIKFKNETYTRINRKPGFQVL